MGDENNYTTLQNPASPYTASTNVIKVAVKAVVGEKILLSSFLQTQVLLTGIKWDIPVAAIKKYYNTIEVGLIDPIMPADKTKKDLAIYWVEGGRQVVKGNASYNFAGNAYTLFYELNFDVDTPKFVRLEAKTSKVNLRKEKRNWILEFKEPLSETKSNPGIVWDWEVAMPASSAGFLKDLQTIKPGGRIKLQALGDGKGTRTLIRGSTKGDGDIVDDDPVEGKKVRETTYDIAMFSDPEKIAAGESRSNSGIHDSPASTLQPLDQHIWIDEHFKYFVLFKPDKADAIWVPVAKAEWFWKAEAVRVKASWKLKSRSAGVSKGEATKEFPLYDGNAQNHDWIEKK